MAASDLIRLHAIVEGRVQGVGFRNFVLDKATRLELTGWVRNRWNGDVECLAEGDRQALDKLLAALQRGPRSGFVANVRVNWQEASGEYTHFRVKPTE
jgi:acylphosphatase